MKINNWFKILTYFVLSPLAVVLFIAFIVQYDKTTQVVANNDVMISNYNTKTLQDSNSRLKLDATGSDSSAETKSVKQLNSLFTDVTTWTSGKVYTQHRNSVMKVMKGDAFYSNVYIKDSDSTGNSIVDALNTKSKTNTVNVFKTGTNSYHVIVTSYGYHKLSDLQQASNLTSTSMSVEVTGSYNNWTVSRIDSGFSGE